MTWEFCRFDIAFKDIAILEKFELELGAKSTDGSWSEGTYIATFRADDILGQNPISVRKLVDLFHRYEEEELAEEASAVQCWIDLEEFERGF